MIYKKIYHKNKKDYLKLVDEKLILSHDWFSNNITTWINIFSEQNLKKKIRNFRNWILRRSISCIFCQLF